MERNRLMDKIRTDLGYDDDNDIPPALNRSLRLLESTRISEIWYTDDGVLVREGYILPAVKFIEGLSIQMHQGSITGYHLTANGSQPTFETDNIGEIFASAYRDFVDSQEVTRSTALVSQSSAQVAIEVGRLLDIPIAAIFFIGNTPRTQTDEFLAHLVNVPPLQVIDFIRRARIGRR